ncbi:hypothetical protein VOLCADRAFT_90902 [Volvox carteri f. nagariensis]|uniref:Uncharacterized protein n=1 Tax=Volvox carteri f. nagariensis TaxID=3068 RepID=D8TVD3_VOLCA|nr:uncharacterized protein VOLCADRAFT_90902 [Volvox carteri f. nagariensis]EFJ48557.1 hypothetical protein VOLCADRAFT_90902 [Volvox carteri f. nagariensis]|eukprot:XP_002950356.1 hypothetical protein VOLCADRAFT_90902 [Volvox carteri f. nagariensis]
MQGYCICKHLQYASICNPDAPERVRTRTRATAPSGPQGPRLVASVTGSRPGLVGKSRSIGWFRSFAFSLARTLFTIRGRGFESHSASFELHTETRGCEDDRSRVRITGRTRVAGEDARTRGHQDVRTRGCKGTWTRERVGICPVRMQPERCRREPTGRLSKWRWIEQQLQRDGQMHEPTGHLSKWWRTKQQLLLGGRIPEAALARYDGGDVPEINQDGQHLEWPTVLEANILGLGHVQQQIYMLKVKNRPPDLQPITVTMHKIAMANPSLDQWVDTIPCSAVSLPENITVLCMDVVSSKEELLEKLKSTKVLSIRAANIVAWVNYLSNLTSERHIDDQAMKEWQAMDPECHKRTTHRRMLVSRSSEFWCLLSLTQLCRDQVMMHETRWSYTILDYSREDVLASNFPTAFLYTKGGLRPLGMSNRTFFQHVSTRVPQRQPPHARPHGGCAQHGGRKSADMGYSEVLPAGHRHVARIDMTDAYYHNVHANLRGVATATGLPILMFNVNPADLHSAAAVVAAGQFLEFGEDGAPLWEERVMDKWWRVRNNPYTSQALLNTVKLAFMDILFGFKPGDKRQSNPDCFCGTVFHICICYMAARGEELHLFAVPCMMADFCNATLRCCYTTHS